MFFQEKENIFFQEIKPYGKLLTENRWEEESDFDAVIKRKQK